MKKFLILFIFSLGFILMSYSAVEYSPAKKGSSKQVISTVLLQNFKGVYVLRQEPSNKMRNIEIDLYNIKNNFDIIKSKKYLFNKNEFLIQIYPCDEGLFLFYGIYNPNNKKDYLYMKKIDEDLVSPIKDSLITIIDDKDVNLAEIFINSDKNGVNYLLTYPDFSNKSNYNLIIKKFDTSGIIYIDERISYPSLKNVLLVDVGFLNNSILGIFKSAEEKADNGFAELKLFKYNIRTKSNNEVIIENDSQKVRDCLLKTDIIHQRFIVAGLYSDQLREELQGFYLTLLYDSILGNAALQQLPFDTKLQRQGIQNKIRVEDFYTTRTSDVVSLENKGVIIVCEESRSVREMVPDITVNGFTQASYRYYFIYNNLNVMNVSESGSILWQKILPKEQVTINDNGINSSYILHKMPDKLVFIYNDFSRNRDALSAHILFGNGTFESKILLRPNEYRYKLNPREGNQINNKEIIIPGVSNRGAILSKFKF